MHPNAIFRWTDRDAMRAMVADVAFGSLFAATPDGPRVAHVPVVWLDDDTLGLHVARGNGIARHLDGASALVSVLGPDGYVSPDWYGLGPEQVPTWNYVAVELEGIAHRMERDALVAVIDQLVADQESRIDHPPWSRAKMAAGQFDAMLSGIIGFRIAITAWRGTLKLGQHKPEAARRSAGDGVAASGRTAIAQLMRTIA